MKTHESEEMYLETILLLKKTKEHVRSVDIVDDLGYAKSSVSRAVNLLVKRGYIVIDQMGNITLTEQGEQKACGIYERHEVIKQLLQLMGANDELAENDACRIEHVISDEMFGLLKQYLSTKR